MIIALTNYHDSTSLVARKDTYICCLVCDLNLGGLQISIDVEIESLGGWILKSLIIPCWRWL